MSQLVAFYEEKPLDLKSRVEIHQEPIVAAEGIRSTEGALRPSLVYVSRASEAGPFLVPFAEYDDWSLRDLPPSHRRKNNLEKTISIGP